MISIIFLMTLNILVGLLMGLTPYISRQNFPFGVSLPVTLETKEMIKKQKKSYLIINVGLSIILSFGVILISFIKTDVSEENLFLASLISMFIILIVSLVTYVTKHNSMRAYKKILNVDQINQKKIVVDLSFRDEKLIFPTSYLVGLNLAFVLITMFVTVTNYSAIPEMIVTQWDFNMNPTTITEKTWGSVMFIPVMQLFMTGVMAISNQSFLLAKQQIDGSTPSTSVAKSKRFRKQSSLLNFIISILSQLLFLSIQLTIIFENISPKIVMAISIGFMIIIIGLVFWYSLYYGQSGERLKHGTPSLNEDVKGDVSYDDDDDHWKLGMIYFNSNDPSFWVEKRMGIGMTFNMAKWQSWAFIAVITMFPFLIIYLMM